MVCGWEFKPMSMLLLSPMLGLGQRVKEVSRFSLYVLFTSECLVISFQEHLLFIFSGILEVDKWWQYVIFQIVFLDILFQELMLFTFSWLWR